jgi:hypothetical protein
VPLVFLLLVILPLSGCSSKQLAEGTQNDTTLQAVIPNAAPEITPVQQETEAAPIATPNDTLPQANIPDALLKESPVKQANGVVLNIWLENTSVLDVFADNNIKYLFVDVGNTAVDGRLETGAEEISSFIGLVRAYQTDNNMNFTLLAYSEIYTENYNITDAKFQENFIGQSGRFIEMGFDGILVDIEPVPDNTKEALLAIINGLQTQLPEKTLIAVYSGSPGNNSVNPWEWDSQLFMDVSDLVNIIFVQGYDTGLATAEEYKEYIRKNVKTLSGFNWKPSLFFGVPTHNPYPETTENALDAYSQAFKETPNNKFLGLAVFAEWTTDLAEWQMFSDYARNPSKQDLSGE